MNHLLPVLEMWSKNLLQASKVQCRQGYVHSSYVTCSRLHLCKVRDMNKFITGRHGHLPRKWRNSIRMHWMISQYKGLQYLMSKVFYTFKELKSKISILFSFFSKYWKLENKPYYSAYARTVGSWSNSRAWFFIVGQNSKVKLMPNERSRLILKGSRFKLSGISPCAKPR